MQLTRRQTASIVPIEDMKDGDVVHISQRLPDEKLNVAAVTELAFLGLSNHGIAARLRIPDETLTAHFSKTLAAARADAAVDALMRLHETASGDFKPTAPQLDATKHLLEKRFDPLPKEGTNILIHQSFKGLESMAANFTIEQLNEI
jgi:hypothetical protein